MSVQSVMVEALRKVEKDCLGCGHVIWHSSDSAGQEFLAGYHDFAVRYTNKYRRDDRPRIISVTI